MRTARDIIEQMSGLAVNGSAVPPIHWLNLAVELINLQGNETDKMYALEENFNRVINFYLTQGEPFNKAEKRAKLDPSYMEYNKQKTLLKQIDQSIMLAKKYAQLSQDEFRNTGGF